MENELKSLINEIKEKKSEGKFKNYIDYIRFPFYRNLERNTKINFDFPLTIFVGQNGSGKSSCLQALYGAPGKSSTGDYWFETKVDHIEETEKEYNRFVYGYYSEVAERAVEVRKSRGQYDKKDKKNPDYWEPTRPIISDQMEKMPPVPENAPKGKWKKSWKGRWKTRWEVIKKNVCYLDFRSELSSFDKCFYFYKPSNEKTKQDYLRTKSAYLKNVIDKNIVTTSGVNLVPQNEKIRVLTDYELLEISKIIGKKYINGKIVKHKLFHDWGYSVIFKTDQFEYSDAYAGSGETAVIRLVSEILTAKDDSLILLDEPEVSLYPGAQKRLNLFLLKQIQKKRLQIVISTHSPNLLESFPKEAIKVFHQRPSGKFHVISDVLPEQAFYYLEQDNPKKKAIIVEDKLAKVLLDTVINTMSISDEKKTILEIKYYPGGDSVIKQNIHAYSKEEEENKFIILDGDQEECHIDLTEVPDKELTLAYLKERIEEQTRFEIKIYPDSSGSNGGKEEQKIDLMKKYLEFYYKHVFYLPGTPESIIWSDELCKDFLKARKLEEKYDYIKCIKEKNIYKEKFKKLTEILSLNSTATHIFHWHDVFLKHWLDKKNEDYDSIVKTINKIIDFNLDT